MSSLQELLDEQHVSLMHVGLLIEKLRDARDRLEALHQFRTREAWQPFEAYQELEQSLEREIERLETEVDSTNRHIDNLEEAQKRHPDSVWRSLEIVEMARLGR